MMNILHLLDLAALAVMWWCSIAALAGGHVVLRMRDLAMGLGLIGVMVFSFAGFAYLSSTGAQSMWWSTGLRIAGALVMAAFYEYRFGIGRHLRMARDWALALPGCLATRWRRWLHPSTKGRA